MKRNKRILGVLFSAALITVLIPVSEADASTSASDFGIEESTSEPDQDSAAAISDLLKAIGQGAFEDNAEDTPEPDQDSAATISDLLKAIGQEALDDNEESTPTTEGEAEPTPTQSPAPTPTPVPSGNELGSTQVVGNRAVLLLDNSKLPVLDGSVTGDNVLPSLTEGTAESGGNKIPKFRIVDGRIVAAQAYYRNSSLGTVVLPEGISEIGEFAYGRSSLEAVTLPQGAERIAYGAFYHCDALREVNLPDSIKYVEPKAFSQTAWVNEFLNGKSQGDESDFLVEGGVLAAYRGNSSQVEIPEGVRTIAGEAFLNHGEIERVLLPDSLLVIGEGAFEGCGNLREIVFGRNVEEIKDRAFQDNAITDIIIPSSVNKLGIRAFGDTILTYEGSEPEQTYEASAARLSNTAYRVYPEDMGQDIGLTVEGLEEIFGAAAGERFRRELSTLSGADRSYTLTVKVTEDTEAMSAAFARALRAALPQGMLLYDLELTDASGIPMGKLGKETLRVILPVPEMFLGQELQIYALDENGQLESVPVELMNVEGAEAFGFEMNFLSKIGVAAVR